MEERTISTHLCSNIVQQWIVNRALAQLPPTRKKVAVFSLKESEKLAKSLMVSEDYLVDKSSCRLSQDLQAPSHNKSSIRIHPPANLQRSTKTSQFSRQSSKHLAQQKQIITAVNSPINQPKLKPLESFQESEPSQQESDDLETRLRERKIHQQFYRTRFQQNMRQGAIRKHGVNIKNEGKGHSNITAYDFDGGIIQSNSTKQEGVKIPIHFVDLDVEVAEKPEEKEVKKRVNGKQKGQPKRESIKREEIKTIQHYFLKDLNAIRWVEGVELKQSKQQCRKILGYQQQSTVPRHKKLDLLKPSAQPLRIKFEDLSNYKTLVSSSSCLNNSQLFSAPTQKSMMSRNSRGFAMFQNGQKYIKVTNSKALEYLINDQAEPPKKSLFSTVPKVSHFKY